MNNKVICYFSASGRTKMVSEKVSKLLNTDLFEIVPKEKYTNEDLDWTNKNSRSSVEMEKDIKPEIVNKLENINKYSDVIISFPVWWYKEPTIIDKFIEENNLDGKNIYIFVTSGSSTYDGSFQNLKTKYPNLNFVSGKTLNHISEDELLNWIK